MKNYSYTIIANRYASSQDLAKLLESNLEAYKVKRNDQCPDIVFVIGGDGTFLKAVHDYNDQLEKVKFATIKCGKLGFYENFSSEQLSDLLTWIDNDSSQLIISELDLLEIKFSNKTIYAINEVKIANNSRTIICDLKVNDELIETFRGTGVVISTPTGSTGFIKSIGGAILFTSRPLMQLHEIAAVAHNLYRSINSPLVFESSDKLSIIGKMDVKLLQEAQLIIDTFIYNDPSVDDIRVSLAPIKLKVLDYYPLKRSLLAKVRASFIKE